MEALKYKIAKSKSCVILATAQKVIRYFVGTYQLATNLNTYNILIIDFQTVVYIGQQVNKLNFRRFCRILIIVRSKEA